MVYTGQKSTVIIASPEFISGAAVPAAGPVNTFGQPGNSRKKLMTTRFYRPVSIAPLVTFRILLGALMAFGALRTMAMGWVEKLYTEPALFFKFYGFDWVKPLDGPLMYGVFSTIAISAFLVMLGLFYRVAIVTFFLVFTYVELIDATNYLNHYYLVCLVSFLLIFLPANRAFSLDVLRKPHLKITKIPFWMTGILMLQLTIVYTCAGIAKINPDWLFRAMPLGIWLPEHTDLPVLGYFFQFKWTAYILSWAGAFYDLTIAFFLMNRRTRPFAFFMVMVFHVLTSLLFNIGLFPLIMISAALIFFPGTVHEKWLGRIGYCPDVGRVYRKETTRKFLMPALGVFMLLQLLLPFRHLLYPGDTMWTEEGYRFSWRVMLVEKSGHVTFHVRDAVTERQTEIVNGNYLTLFQEKQMSIQPDFILQFAHFLKEEYQTRHGFVDPVITVDAHVAINGRTSRRFIDPEVNLAAIEDDLLPKSWILHTPD